MSEIVFWQSMISPHQAGLVRALAARPGVSVTYVAAEAVEAGRAAMGWQQPNLGKAKLKLAPTQDAIVETLESFSPDALHLCQGFRGNGVIEHALPALAAKHARIGVMMEAVDRRGKTGWLKKPLYRRQVQRFGQAVAFCLAIGNETGRFIAQCGFPSNRIFPFSYFLSPAGETPAFTSTKPGARIAYVGKFIDLKRVDLLIDAFGELNLPAARLSLVGAGPLEQKLRARAAAQPNAGAIEWFGTLANEEARRVIASADCLVLPSEYDGWGAVVSEALLSGTPVICSSACGAAVAVEHSGTGGVFVSGDKNSLKRLLCAQVLGLPQSRSRRADLRAWATQALSAEAGARYLEAIIASLEHNAPPPPAPWLPAHTLEYPQEIKTFVTR